MPVILGDFLRFIRVQRRLGGMNNYEVHPVSRDTYHAVEIGDDFNGGKVVDGFLDRDLERARETYCLVVRRG